MESVKDDALLCDEDVQNRIKSDRTAHCRTHGINDDHLEAWDLAKDAAAIELRESGYDGVFDMTLDIARRRPAAWAALADAPTLF